MELIHRKIPREFLEILPDGLKFIRKHGKEFLVVEELFCPNGHSLMGESVWIHDEPSIKIAMDRSNGIGRIFIDAFWGSCAKLYDFFPAPSEETTHLKAQCPFCGEARNRIAENLDPVLPLMPSRITYVPAV